jgi:xanthine dehydrogenase accessory factor
MGGVLPGRLRKRLVVGKGMKVGGIAPPGIKEFAGTISRKARAIAGGVLEIPEGEPEFPHEGDADSL